METVYVVLVSFGGPCFTVHAVCRTRKRADAIVAAQQHVGPGGGRRQWLIQPIDVDEAEG